MIYRLGPVADAEAVDQRGRLLIAGYAVKRLSASLSPRDRRESGRAVPRGSLRARSALSASTRESGAAARAARETLGLLGRNGEAPSDRSLGVSVDRPSPSGWRREKNGSAWGAACEPFSPALWRTARRESRRPAESEPLRFRRVEGAEPGRPSAFAPSSRAWAGTRDRSLQTRPRIIEVAAPTRMTVSPLATTTPPVAMA